MFCLNFTWETKHADLSPQIWICFQYLYLNCLTDRKVFMSFLPGKEKNFQRNERFCWQLRAVRVYIGQVPKHPFGSRAHYPLLWYPLWPGLIHGCSSKEFSFSVPLILLDLVVPIFNCILSPDSVPVSYWAFLMLSHPGKIFSLQFWLLGTNPILPSYPTPCCGELHCGESGLCWSWRPHWTQWRTQWILGPGLGKRNFYWSGMNSYRNLERRLSMELEWAKDACGVLYQWYFISWDKC